MRKLKLRAKRFLPLLLALAVLFSSASPALGAETVSDAASTIQLMKTEGDVSVTNRSGRALSVRKDMRLYSGYHAKTEEGSYAWVNLDSSKLIKLDEVSEAEVRKSGKKLEVLLDSGNLYFDVSQPLDRTESLNIRTSTMIVGIRGTCGWVKMFDAWHAQVYLLEGRVECSVTDPATGESRTTVLQGGETAEFVVYPQGQTGERCEIIRESYSEEEIDGFVLVELVKDQPLCEKIYADSSLDVLGRYDQDSAQKRLEEDQAAMGEKLGQIEKDLSAQDNHVSQDPVWDGGSKDSGGSDSSGGGSDSSGGDSGSGDSGGSTTAPESSVVTLTMPVTDMALQQALNRPAVRQVAVAPGAAPSTLDIGISMAVDSGKTLTLNSGVPVRVQGSLTVNGTVDAGDDLTNDGTVTVNSANTLRVAGSLTNNGAMTVTATGRCVTEGAFTNSAGASLALTEGAQVLAGRFVLTAPVEGWSVSSTQSDGYYRLEPSASEPSVPEDPGVTAGDFTVTGGALDTDFSYADGVLTILTDTALTIKNTDPSTATTDRILVTKDQAANITLAGVNIGTSDAAAFEIPMNSKGDVTITLASGTENTLISGGEYAGLSKHVRNDTSSGHSTPTAAQMGGTLTIQGSGKLTAQSAGGAGIGGGSIRTAGFINVCSTANIAITGGTIIATGGANSAGIGGGSASDAFNIFISGTADVTATGGSSGGAGIGGGYESNGGSVSGVPGIVIAGGKVTATGGDFGGAGIGGGYRGNSGKIEITGGTITAAGKDRAAGIGGGTKYDGASGAGVNGGEATVIISGGAITATGGSNGGPGIGSGGCSNTYSGSATVNISGSAVVTATGGGGAPGIGCGIGTSATNNASGHITISDSADVTGNVSVNRGSFTISGGEVKSSDGNAVTAADGVTLTLTGGTITCDASNYSALSLGNTKDFPDECKTVIRGKDFAMQTLPNGYANNQHDDDKYYYLEPSAAAGGFTVIGGTENVDYSLTADERGQNTLTILTDKALTIRNANPDTATTDHILVADGVSANVTLAGVNIDTSNVSGGAAAFAIAPGSTGNVTVTLADGTTNTLASPGTHAGLETTAREGGGGGMLTITGTGTLAAGSVYAGSGTDVSAGIGAPYLRPTGNITIAGGTLSGSSGYGAPFIGEYNGTSTSDLTATLRITGGTITGDITVINKANLTVSGGTVTGNISASSFDMSDGTVNGAVSGITDSFTISGGEIVSDAKKDYTVSVDQTATVHLNGGTITNNCTSEASGRYGAIFITESISAIEGEIKTDIRGKKDDLMALCRLTPDTLYGPYTPDGYAVRGPADDGYYHLVYAPTGDFTVTGGTQDSDYSYADGVLTILTGTPLTIQNTDPSTATTDCILVADGVSANITLAGVNIDVSGTGSAGSSSAAGEFGEAAFKAGSGGTVTVTLTGTNTLLGGHGRAGLEAGETADSTLIVQGSGALTATGGSIYTYQELGSYYSSGSGAGIGASYGNGPGNIVIEGGTITANSTGMANSVGIGSNTLPADSANSVQITGGTITGGPSLTDRSVITKQLTMSGGTVNGDIAASRFDMSAGTVNGRVLAVRSSFTISGGEIASSDRRTVEAASDLASVLITVNLNGGTITNNSNEADCSAILIGQYTTITGAIETDIRSKSGETLIVWSNSPTDYTPYTPDGYAVTGPDETGYYHLTPWTKTTINYQNATAEAIQTAFESSDEVYLATNSTNKIFINIADDLTIPAGKTLSVEENSRLVIGQEGVSAPTFTVNGTLKVGTELGVYGALNIAEGGVLDVPSYVYVYNGASIQNSGRFVMRFSGRALVGYTGSSIVNNATGTLEALEPNELSAASVTNSGTISNFYNITGLTMLGGEITANTTGAILFLTDSTSLRGGIITQENPSSAVARYPAAEYTLPNDISTDLRGRGTALLKDSTGTDVTETKGYTAELREDGYYYLVKKEENP